jgi:hypothetical protein
MPHPPPPDFVAYMTSAGYHQNVEVRCGAKHGHKVYRLAFANGRDQIAIEFGRPAPRRDAILRELGWTIIRL